MKKQKKNKKNIQPRLLMFDAKRKTYLNLSNHSMFMTKFTGSILNIHAAQQPDG